MSVCFIKNFQNFSCWSDSTNQSSEENCDMCVLSKACQKIFEKVKSILSQEPVPWISENVQSLCNISLEIIHF